MPRYIAFLRAINVGGHTVKMEALRAMFRSLGFAGVETFIASGNVAFDSPAQNAATLERSIEDHLRETLGYDVATFIRTPEQLSAIARRISTDRSNTQGLDARMYVAFLSSSPAAMARKKLLSMCNEIDTFRFEGREMYWRRRRKLSDAEYPAPPLERILGIPLTLRNATTVQKIADKVAAA